MLRSAHSRNSISSGDQSRRARGGEGVVIAQNRMEGGDGDSRVGPRLIIEEFLQGEEVSFIVMTDGRNFAGARGRRKITKPVCDGDSDRTLAAWRVLRRTYFDGSAIAARDRHDIEPADPPTGFTGFLYAGLMMTSAGPKVLEFNVRLGESGDAAVDASARFGFADMLMRGATGSLAGAGLRWKADPSVWRCSRLRDTRGQVRPGDMIHGITGCGALVFQAGTKVTERGLENRRGSRARCHGFRSDAGLGDFERLWSRGTHSFDGMHYRRDIGQKGLKRWP